MRFEPPKKCTVIKVVQNVIATYMILTPEQKARLGKHTTESGTTKTTRYFAKDVPNLKESTVRVWKMAYLHEFFQ